MKLVKVQNENGKSKTCLINDSINSGEYTCCSIACDSMFEHEGVEWTDKKPAKNITCEECRSIVKWYHAIKL